MRTLARIAILLLGASAASVVYAGGPLSVCNDAARTPVKYSGTGTVNLNYDQGTLGPRSKAQADAIVTAAVSLWTNVGTSSVVIGRGADLPVDVTTANYATYNTSSDGINPVIYDTDGSIIDMLFGAGAKNSTLGFAGSSFFLSPTCRYTEGRAVISGFISISDTTLNITIAHEIGHLIGLDHSQLNATQGIASAGNRPLMYPIASRNVISLHEDDESAVTALYPDTNVGTVYGELTGTFVLADGVTPVRGANLWATETTTNKVYSIVSDYRQQNTGFFRLLLPEGAYNLRAGTIATNFTGGSSVGPYSEDSTQLSFQPPLYNGGVAMANVTLGNATPTVFNISAGCQGTLTFRLNGTGTVGGNCTAPGSYTVNVIKAGTGTGTVTSAPAGINCGATCSAAFATGSMVTLTATPSGGSSFAGWSGACSGTGNCTITVNNLLNVTASFAPAGAASEVFPAACAFPAGWTTPVGANAGWSVVFNDFTEGLCSLKSNPIGNSESAQMQVTGTFTAGTVSFARRVSSEAGWDCFRFYVDDVAQPISGTCSNIGGNGASGTVPWGTVSVNITAGTHTLRWSYEKDTSDVAGEDAAYIDALVLPLPTGTLQFTASAVSVSESAANAVVTVSRTGGATGSASVNYSTANGTATAGSDYTAQSGTLNWTADDSASKTISIPILNESLVEGNETFTVTISSPTGATLGATSSVTVTITNDDVNTAPTAPTIGTVNPGNGQAIVNFTASTSDGGSPITGYTATCNAGGFTGAGTFSPITVDGLTNGVTYGCSVTATNAIGTSGASATVNVTPSAGAPVALVGVVSRKVHSAAGTFELDINSSIAAGGLVTVEPRTIGTGHLIVFSFSGPVITTGTVALLDPTNPFGSASATISGNDVLVTLTGVPDNRRARVTLTGVNGTTNAAANIGFLVGDVGRNRSVTASDIAATKARVGITLNANNYLSDLNLSGGIDGIDVSAAKARSGLTLPAFP